MKLFLQQFVKETERRMLLLFQPWKLERYPRSQGEDKSLEPDGGWCPDFSPGVVTAELQVGVWPAAIFFVERNI